MTLNLKFSGISTTLSREEMKQIKGGVVPPPTSFCSSGIACHGTGTCFSYYEGEEETAEEHCCCSVDENGSGGEDVCGI